MDPHPQENSMNSLSSRSSEEFDRVDEESGDQDRVGTGRSYNCVFCKRGFTTAQALGGHMNIHRKDKARSGKSSSSKKYHHHEDHIQTELASTYSSCHDEANRTFQYRIYFPASKHFCGLDPHGFVSPFGSDFNSSFGQVHKVDQAMTRSNHQDAHELDLELRLGYN